MLNTTNCLDSLLNRLRNQRFWRKLRQPTRRRRPNRIGFIEALEDRALLNAAPVFNPDTYSASISEDAAIGALVDTVDATDPDEDVLFYAIAAGDPNGKFSINNEGKITVAASLNYETQATYTLTVHVTDVEELDEATVTINLIDVAEAPVFSPDTYTFSIAEDANNGASVGTVLATDPQNDVLFYAIASGDPNGKFSIDNNGKITVADSLDFEAAATYTLEVHVTDVEFLDEATVTINVTNVNEAPTFDNPVYSFDVSEASPTGTLVGTVSATDPEGASLTFSITGGDPSGDFSIDSNGKITVTGTLDYDTTSTYSLTIQVTDGVFTDTVTVMINVQQA